MASSRSAVRRRMASNRAAKSAWSCFFGMLCPWFLARGLLKRVDERLKPTGGQQRVTVAGAQGRVPEPFPILVDEVEDLILLFICSSDLSVDPGARSDS